MVIDTDAASIYDAKSALVNSKFNLIWIFWMHICKNTTLDKKGILLPTWVQDMKEFINFKDVLGSIEEAMENKYVVCCW